MKVVNYFLSFLIVGLRPLLGPVACRYQVTCSRYALYQLKHKPLGFALKAITARLICCSPLQKLCSKSTQFATLADLKEDITK
ncbi:membrane protein insertion efficiency factor YidD [Candidatus Babeliales bacterium]|nr:membrane protein insertion efficiency factor YidD [Candidatus Babeliales bacterium]